MITQIKLREDQQQIADSPARFKVVACGRRWGNTTLALVLAIRAAREGKRVWWVAPTYGLAFHPWVELKAALADECAPPRPSAPPHRNHRRGPNDGHREQDLPLHLVRWAGG